MTSVQGIDVTNVLWKDNKCVRLASTYAGIERFARTNPDEQTAKACRYDGKQKKFIEINCPQIIREYNAHMGGVDLMDGLMGRYHIRAKTLNIMIRLFYHFVDMAAKNAFYTNVFMPRRQMIPVMCPMTNNFYSFQNFVAK